MTSLADHSPHIAAEWDHELNADSPSDVTAFSNRKRHWNCTNGHHWEAVVANRVLGRGCPFCSNRRTLVGYNDIGTTYPDLASQVHQDSQVRADEVTKSSSKKLLWQCDSDAEHTWTAAVYSRITNGSGCPLCVDKQNPQIEKDISALLPGSLLHQVVTTWPGTNRPVEVDILFGNTIVEYDGFWHANREEQDIRKTEFLLSLGYQVVRIRQHPLNPITLVHENLTQIPFKYSAEESAVHSLLSHMPVASEPVLSGPVLHVVLSGGPSATCHNLSGCPLDVNPGSETSR